jgi:phospholipid transport system substrate-binding protein
VWFTFTLSSIAVAAEINSAEELLKNNLDAVLAILQKKNLDLDVKKKEIAAIVTPIFDFALMSKLTLGKKHWPGLPQEKKERFTELFIELLKDTYLDSVTLYTNEKVVFKETVQVKNRVHIPAELISENNKYSMLYKFYKSKQGWKIYDIEVQGVSLIRTYRSQFDSVLSKGTIDDLILKLETHDIDMPKPSTESKPST